MKVRILKPFNTDDFEEGSPAWHGVIDLSWFDSNEPILISNIAKVHGITEDDVMHNLSVLLQKELITLVD